MKDRPLNKANDRKVSAKDRKQIVESLARLIVERVRREAKKAGN